MEFKQPPRRLLEVLTAADMVTGPEGAWIRADDRVSEILQRYGSWHPVHKAVIRSAPELLAAVKRFEARAGVSVQPPQG